MGDWFFGLITGIILTTIVGWACLRRQPCMTWKEDDRKELNAKDPENVSNQEDDSIRRTDV